MIILSLSKYLDLSWLGIVVSNLWLYIIFVNKFMNMAIRS